MAPPQEQMWTYGRPFPAAEVMVKLGRDDQSSSAMQQACCDETSPASRMCVQGQSPPPPPPPPPARELPAEASGSQNPPSPFMARLSFLSCAISHQ